MTEVISIDDIKDKVDERVKETEKETSGGGSDFEIDSKFIMECLNKNELGDGELFKKLFRNDFVFNKSMDTWMKWNDHHWIIDKMDNVLASVEKVALVYQDQAKKISKEINEFLAKDESAKHLETKRAALKTRLSSFFVTL